MQPGSLIHVRSFVPERDDDGDDRMDIQMGEAASGVSCRALLVRFGIRKEILNFYIQFADGREWIARNGEG